MTEHEMFIAEGWNAETRINNPRAVTVYTIKKNKVGVTVTRTGGSREWDVAVGWGDERISCRSGGSAAGAVRGALTAAMEASDIGGRRPDVLRTLLKMSINLPAGLEKGGI